MPSGFLVTSGGSENEDISMFWLSSGIPKEVRELQSRLVFQFRVNKVSFLINKLLPRIRTDTIYIRIWEMLH
jgi:hypothetical protein